LHEATLVRIEVLDTGVGIPANQLAYIYESSIRSGSQPTPRAMDTAWG